jgi:hypothetical protein
MSSADLTFYIDIRKEIHFDTSQSIPLTGFATPSFDVETETTCPISSFFRLRERGIKISDRSK